MTKADKGLPEVGTVMEFSKDGKMKIIAKDDGKERSRDGVYKVEGDSTHFTLKAGDKEVKTDPLTIKKVSEQELVLEAKKGAAFGLKRVK